MNKTWSEQTVLGENYNAWTSRVLHNSSFNTHDEAAETTVYYNLRAFVHNYLNAFRMIDQ